MNNYDMIVIGAGAAGLISAGFSAKQKQSVLVIEKKAKAGRKVVVTGKGRCNVTNNCDEQTFVRQVKTNGRFLYSAIHAFNTTDTINFFEEQGVPLKTERGNRVFPESDCSLDVVDAMVRFANKNGVKFVNNTAKSLLLENGLLKGVICENGERYYSKKVVIATGGLSYPLTGSTGDGYRMAQEVGHTIVRPIPSLVPIILSEKWCEELMGLSLKNVVVRLLDTKKNKTIFEEIGEMLFTHFGVSGPLILSCSSHMDIQVQKYRIFIDLKPALSMEQLDTRILRDFEKYKNKEFSNALDDLLPKKMIPIMIMRSEIDGSTKVHQVTKLQRQKLVELFKSFPLTPVGFRPIDEAIITSGGISTTEINPKTMESKILKGLYFAGEVIDVDAYTGGYNLQIAYCTGYLTSQSHAI
ncbi:MAG: NAD(P)/FAD-dependent oxidoreductase [Oscillospiraceae bacterium]